MSFYLSYIIKTTPRHPVLSLFVSLDVQTKSEDETETNGGLASFKQWVTETAPELCLAEWQQWNNQTSVGRVACEIYTFSGSAWPECDKSLRKCVQIVLQHTVL